MTHDLHVGFQWYDGQGRPAAQLERLGLDHGSRRPPRAARGHDDSRRSSPRGTRRRRPAPRRRSSRNTARAASKSTTRSGWSNWTFNIGLLASNDTLYGQGLREDSSKPLTGLRAAQGVKYEMYDIPFSKMIQPRLAATWAYNGPDTMYASFARYNPAASSLPRAASWDRNLIGTFIDAHFDANGELFASVPVGSSSGKLFVEDLDPRVTDE